MVICKSGYQKVYSKAVDTVVILTLKVVFITYIRCQQAKAPSLFKYLHSPTLASINRTLQKNTWYPSHYPKMGICTRCQTSLYKKVIQCQLQLLRPCCVQMGRRQDYYAPYLTICLLASCAALSSTATCSVSFTFLLKSPFSFSSLSSLSFFSFFVFGFSSLMLLK